MHLHDDARKGELNKIMKQGHNKQITLNKDKMLNILC